MGQKLKSMNEQICDYILDLINIGKLDYGDKVDEVYYAEQLGISRPTLHDAFIRMSFDGILKNVPRKGFFVETIQQEDIEEKYEIIGLLDAHAAKMALPSMTKEDFTQMRFMLEKMQHFIDGEFFEEYYTVQKDFHQFYREKCGRPILVDLLNKIARSILRTSFYPHGEVEIDRKQVFGVLNKEHEMILEAMTEGDAAKVETLLYEHWTMALRKRLGKEGNRGE